MCSFVPLVIFLAGCLFGTCSAEAVPDSRPFAGVVISYQDIHSVDITGTILKEDKSLREWADELERTEPKTPRDVMTTYLVCLRAGRDETVCKMIPLLFNMFSTMPPEAGYRSTLIGYVFAPLRDLSGERRHVFTTFCETFDTIYCPSNLPQTISNAEWLRQRWQNACEREPEPDEWEQNPYHHGIWFVPTTLPPTALQWQRSYLKQLQLTGKEQAELERLNNEAKESPHDARKMPLLINGLYIRYGFSDIIQQNLDWFIPTAEKRPAFEAWSIAQFFKDRKSPNTQKIREVFLDRALAVPLTAEECNMYRHYLQSMSSREQPKRSDKLIRAMFRSDVMKGLHSLYRDTNRNDEAQKIMLELQRIRQRIANLEY